MPHLNDEVTALRRYGDDIRIPQIRKSEEDLFRSAVLAAAPRRILEIGTGIGYSALLMATLLPQAEIVTIEPFAPRYREARKRMQQAGVEDRVTVVSATAEEALREIKGPFDLLYLDGSKGHYLEHLRLAEPLLQKNATVLADNVLFRGYVCADDRDVPRRMRTIAHRMRAFLAYVKDPRYFTTKIYETGDGFAVARRKG